MTEPTGGQLRSAAPADPEPQPETGELPVEVVEALADPAVLGPDWQEEPPSLVEMTGSLPAITMAPQAQRRRWLAHSWLMPRWPVILAVAVVALVGLPQVFGNVGAVLQDFPVAGPGTALLWALYAVPLVYLINRFDFFEREPLPLVLGALAWGGLVVPGLAVPANAAVFSLLRSAYGEAFVESWGPAIAGPFVEEVLKGIGVLAAILLTRRRIRSAVDGFVIGAVVGVGFQAVENFLYTGNILQVVPQSGVAPAVAEVFLLRGVVSGLWSHALYSGLVGLGLGYAFTRQNRSVGRRLVVVLGLYALAVGLHALWNSPVLPTSQGLVPILTKGVVSLTAFLIVIRRAQRRESTIYTDYLADLDEPLLATRAEIENLRTFGTRHAVVSAAGQAYGGEAADAVRLLHRGQADLAVALAVGDVGGQHAAAQTIQFARSDMAALGTQKLRIGHRQGMVAIGLCAAGVLLPQPWGWPVLLLALAVAARGIRRASLGESRPASSLYAAAAMVPVSAALIVLLGFVVGQWPDPPDWLAPWQ